MKIGIASDHRGYELKQKIIKDMKGIEFVDFGTNSDKSVDYPEPHIAIPKSTFLFIIPVHNLNA